MEVLLYVPVEAVGPGRLVSRVDLSILVVEVGGVKTGRIVFSLRGSDDRPQRDYRIQ